MDDRSNEGLSGTARSAQEQKLDTETFRLLSIARCEVEAQTTGKVLERLYALTDSKEKVLANKGKLLIHIDGYQDDFRELSEIPEMRTFFASVTEAWPYWLWYLSPTTGQIPLLMSWLCPTRIRRGETDGFSIEFIDHDTLHARITDLLTRSAGLFAVHHVPMDELELTIRDAMRSLAR